MLCHVFLTLRLAQAFVCKQLVVRVSGAALPPKSTMQRSAQKTSTNYPAKLTVALTQATGSSVVYAGEPCLSLSYVCPNMFGNPQGSAAC